MAAKPENFEYHALILTDQMIHAGKEVVEYALIILLE